MKMKFTKIYVDNQDKALTFYTEVLGFVKKADFLVGSFRWLTVVSPEEPDGTELLLEPNDNPASKISQAAFFQQGIPATAFAVWDVQHEYERLKQQGVVWTREPTQMGPVTIAIFDDTCGNFIQLVQV
jgi:catechol 2,3-dioxygenase-like lactoylglutathione lyase family enzyme